MTEHTVSISQKERVYYHLIPKDYIQGNHSEFLKSMFENSRWIGVVGNAAMFIISGYFLSFSLLKQDKNFIQFMLHRLFRFWPTLLFAVLCVGVLGLFHLVKFNIGQNVLNLFLITQNGTGLTTQLTNLNATWFVCSLFWCSLFYYSLYRVFHNNYLSNFLSVIISYFCVLLYINFPNVRDFQLIYGILPKSGVLALGMIGWGILLNMLLLEIKVDKIRISSWIASLSEIFLLFYLIHGLLFHKFKQTYLVVILAVTFLLILFIMRRGFLSKFLNKSWVEKIGRYSFSIYIMQEISFVPLKYLWLKFSDFDNSRIWYITLVICSLLFCAFIGVITYHLVEKPAQVYYRKRISGHL